MTLELIGAGFGRTGTLSLKGAIERLGAGPCYHMLEVPRNPGHAERWHAAARGEPTDWDDLFAGYPATVDWPGCHFWRELVARYPEAKVLLSVRSAESWYQSVRATIYQALNRVDEAPEPMRPHLAMGRRIVLENTFDGRFEDEKYAMAVFERHNEEVQAAVPADRLLVYAIGSGWKPLCDFLDVPVPDEEFPHVNTSESFRDRIAEMQKSLQGES